MSKFTETIVYPRRRLQRGLARFAGKILLPLLFKISIQGTNNFPKSGPLIVVGNHAAAMEAVLMGVFTPWQVEMLASGDLPQERITEVVSQFFGVIPIKRGSYDRQAMRQALSVLAQGGILGIFPEGGVWEDGPMRAQTGVAWLSLRSQAPVLPIGFGGTPGALGAALRGERPRLSMHVGELIEAAEPDENGSRRENLQHYAEKVVRAVHQLRDHGEGYYRKRVRNEHFELLVRRIGAAGERKVELGHAAAVAKLLHRPAILKIFRQNLEMPVAPLQNLEDVHAPEAIATALKSILAYLQNENPYLLHYRFGPKEAESMQKGLESLLIEAQAAAQKRERLKITPVRRYITETGEEVMQTRQESFEGWM